MCSRTAASSGSSASSVPTTKASRSSPNLTVKWSASLIPVSTATPEWGALLDNLHVRFDLKRQGVGRALVTETAAVLWQRRPSSGLYLWVLEQNTAAQAFYSAMGGVVVEDRLGGPFPGGGRAPVLRYAWPDPSVLHHPNGG